MSKTRERKETREIREARETRKNKRNKRNNDKHDKQDNNITTTTNKQTNKQTNIYNPPQDSAPGTYREYKKPIFALVLAR